MGDESTGSDEEDENADREGGAEVVVEVCFLLSFPIQKDCL